jgi:hypothetical protein
MGMTILTRFAFRCDVDYFVKVAGGLVPANVICDCAYLLQRRAVSLTVNIAASTASIAASRSFIIRLRAS